MSDQEQEAVIDRIMGELAEAKCKLMDLNRQLAEYETGLQAIADRLVADLQGGTVAEPVENSLRPGTLVEFDFSKLLMLPAEYMEFRHAIDAREQMLQQLSRG